MDSKVLMGLLNPIRMRILQIVLTNETATTRLIAENLPDVPTASLYRHINKLLSDNILEVFAENKIRGTVEKVYKVNINPFKQLEELSAKGNKDDHYNMFYAFTMALLSDFNNYLNKENYNMESDKVGFRSYPLYLSDEECDEFLEDLKNALMKIINNKPSSERKLRKFSFTIMPGDSDD